MSDLSARINQHQSPAVRDLVWALLSPTLINARDSNHNPAQRWYRDAFHLIEAHLHELDLDDTKLVQHLTAPGNQRLGLYFERLWSYWLQHNGRYRMLAHNLQLTQNNRTLGEFDFIVHDTHSDEIEHWELAVKFYLGIPPLHDIQHWFGPNAKDRLDLKHDHLVHKQLTLSETLPGRTTCQQLGWNISQRRLISKGRLYFPFPHHDETPRCIDPQHLHGYWMSQSAWHEQATQHPDSRYSALTRSEWLTWHSRPLQSLDDIQQQLDQQLITHPVQVRVEGWAAQPFRLFLVPDNWHDTALATLHGR